MAVYNRLVEAGFSPNYERYGDYLRVVVSGIREGERENVTRRLGAAGAWFQELY
ncbi:MAG: hypothetical protein LBI90_04450 [Treponema sp.]|jgi:hypothetical protein|nr:hypothetical protein [Treponema sp.]